MPRVGGCFCEINGDQQAWHMAVSFVDPGKTLRLTGGLGLQLGGLANYLRGKAPAPEEEA